MLINVGVDVDVASRSGWTIFHYASKSPPMLQLLLDLLGSNARHIPQRFNNAAIYDNSGRNAESENESDSDCESIS